MALLLVVLVAVVGAPVGAPIRCFVGVVRLCHWGTRRGCPLGLLLVVVVAVVEGTRMGRPLVLSLVLLVTIVGAPVGAAQCCRRWYVLLVCMAAGKIVLLMMSFVLLSVSGALAVIMVWMKAFVVFSAC